MRKFIFFCICFCAFTLTSEVSAQIVTRSIPKGLRVATTEEVNAAVQQLKAVEDSNPQLNSVATETEPLFCIRMTGNFINGIYAVARSCADIPAGTIFFGERTNVYGSKETLNVWFATEIIPSGFLWYDLENARKAAFGEGSGVITESIVAITNDGNIHRYSAKKNFNSYGSAAVTQIVNDGVATMTPDGSAKFVLYGNFTAKVGVSVMIEDLQIEYILPKSAITVNGRNLIINTALVPGTVSFPSGDYTFTVTNSDGYSDSFVVRLNNQPGVNNKRMREILNK